MQSGSSIEECPRAAVAIRTIDRVMQAGNPLVCAFSSGKDSSVVACLMLTAAAARIRAQLACPPLLVIHSDTGVENPEVRTLADGELDKMVAFANANGIGLQIRVGKPLLYTSWPVRVIGGRSLPSFPTSHRDCSVNWKVDVGTRLQHQVFAELRETAHLPQPVLMTGVRIDESSTRAAGIAGRGETDDAVWADAEGRLRLSPILSWTSDDVFEYLGYCNAGVFESYSDFSATLQFYRDAGGSSCAVVGDMRMKEVATQKGGCGARSGCWTCVRVQKDRSLEQMISSDLDRYGYMKGLNGLRNFIANTQYDWDRRTYLGRTIDKNGDVAIQADVYSPSMLEELLRYTLTLQFREQLVAQRKGIEPRFNIIGYREIVAIGALWSLYGLHPPFHALKIFNEVRSGRFLDAPSVEPVARSPIPRLGKLHVGREWEEDRKTGDPKRDRMLASGVRSPLHEMLSDSCGFDVKQTSSGDLVTAWETVGSFEVDEQGAGDFIECFGDEYIAKYHDAGGDRTKEVMTYLEFGFVQPAHGSLARWHGIARRTQWMQRHGLVGEVQRERLLAMMDLQACGEDPFAAGALDLKPTSTPATGRSNSRKYPPVTVDETGAAFVPGPGEQEFAAGLERAYQAELFDAVDSIDRDPGDLGTKMQSEQRN